MKLDTGSTLTALQGREAVPRALVRFGVNRPRGVLAVWMLLSVISTAGVLQLEIETSTDSVLDRSGEPWLFYQRSQDLFGGDEILTLVLVGHQPFDRAALGRSVKATRVLESLDGVRRVDSLATVPLIHTTPDGVVSLKAALGDGVPSGTGDLRRLQELLIADRIAPRNLLSDDRRSVAVNVVLTRNPEIHYDSVFAHINNLRDRKNSWVSGVPVFRTEADARTAAELSFFVPITVVLVGFLLFFLFGSFQAVVISLGVSGVGIWSMLGVMGAVGTPLTISTVILPSILLALGCAYSMHALAASLDCRLPSELSESMQMVALPISLSGLTTAIGFVAVSLVRIDVVRDVGAFGALGVLIILLATLTATPAVLRLWPLRRRHSQLGLWLGGPAAHRLVEFVSKRRRSVIGCWFLVATVTMMGLARLEVETDAVAWFSKGDPIRVAYEAIRDGFSGISPMNVVIESERGEPVTSPHVVAVLRDFTAYLEALPDVGKALSIADPLWQIHRVVSGGARSALPTDADLIEQYLLILESSEYMGDLVTKDRIFANVPLRANNNGSDALLAIAASADAWWEKKGPVGFTARTTGIMYEFARAEDEITMGQLRGLMFAFLAIAAILVTIFRSTKLALIALIPNALPIGMAFGAMGVLGIPLDAGTVLVGNLAMGIAIDDTVHTVTGYYRERVLHQSASVALERTFERVLCPVVFTTVAIAIGFGVLGFSSLVFTRNLGLVTSGIMVLCLFADILLLPALLLGSGRKRTKD